MKGWLFCPENDLALADGGARYTPPKGAMAVARAGRLLPMLWAGVDDEILIPASEWEEEYVRSAEAALRERYGGRGRAVCSLSAQAEPAVWGWSEYTRRIVEENHTEYSGGQQILLPSSESIARMRQLSHRRLTVAVSRRLKEVLGTDVMTPPLPCEMTSVDDVADLAAVYVAEGYRGAVVKLPWSCSSRGILMADPARIDAVKDRIAGMIRRQGSVMVEAWVDRLSDFAMLFESDGSGSVEFRGLSMFVTDGSGRYGGNLVADQATISRRIGRLPAGLEAMVGGVLSEVIGSDYRGWIGVDMMRYVHMGREGIAPCVEVNLRMTMGVAAYLMAERVVGYTGCPELMLSVMPSGISLVPVGQNVLSRV